MNVCSISAGGTNKGIANTEDAWKGKTMIDESVKSKIYELEKAATEDYNNAPYLDEYLEGYRDGLHQAAKELSTAPTVDAVPVVRCRECYYKDEKRIMDEDALWCRKHHMYVTADWFCADGERKDDE